MSRDAEFDVLRRLKENEKTWSSSSRNIFLATLKIKRRSHTMPPDQSVSLPSFSQKNDICDIGNSVFIEWNANRKVCRHNFIDSDWNLSTISFVSINRCNLIKGTHKWPDSLLFGEFFGQKCWRVLQWPFAAFSLQYN